MLIVGGDNRTPQDVKAAMMGSFLQQSGPLPSMPKVAARMMSAMQDPNVAQSQIASLVELDAGLTAQVLRIVNSSLFGLSRRVRDLRHAIGLLGLGEIRNLVMAAASRSVYTRFGPEEQKLWQHSLCSGIVARLVAMTFAPSRRDISFLVGQMHDVGTVLLLQRAQGHTLRQSSSNEDSDRAEELMAFGFSHTDIGALLMNQWNLPPEVEIAAFLHHDLELCATLEPELVDVVAVAVVADCVARPDRVELESKPLRAALDLLHIAAKGFAEMANQWREQALRDSAAFSV